MTLYDLKTLHQTTPVLDETPYFSWKLESSQQNVLQTAYCLSVSLGNSPVWNSGWVSSRRQAFVDYEGPALQSRARYDWTVTVRDNHGQEASASSFFETGLLEASDWSALWAECSFERPAYNDFGLGESRSPVQFRKSFSLSGTVNSAKLYATSCGVYRLWVNGTRPDDREFAPEFTPYEQLQYYQTYDVTSLLKDGANELDFYVADGWYFSSAGQPIMEHPHGNVSVLFQLEVTYEDGRTETVCPDETMTCSLGPVLYGDMFVGEKDDLRRNEHEVHPVELKDYGYGNLRAQPLEPVRPVKLLQAVSVTTSPAGETIVDFGQVLAGRARIQINEPEGQEVSFQYFEILNEEGNFVNTMFVPQVETVISNGQPHEYEAPFTFHGFRYIKVTGMETVRAEDFTAVVLSTAKEELGCFRCSDERLNKLYENILWSQRTNTMSIPTDCPSRERAGWTGDILIYGPTALQNEDVTPFLTSWLAGLRATQQDDGVTMITSPFTQIYNTLMTNLSKVYGEEKFMGVAGWSDAIVWVPYQMYRATGNTRVLKDNFAAMQSWCNYIICTAKNKRGDRGIPEDYDRYLWNTGFHFGEWLIPSQPNDPKNPYWSAETNKYYIAPYFGYQTLRYMEEICAVLGDDENRAYYAEVAENVKQAIQQGLFYADLLPKDLMGAYILAFAFDLVPDDLRDEYHTRLVTLIHENGDRLDTGFLATPYLLDVLRDLGEEDLAHTLLWQDQRPSWLYEVNHGATTVWEAWDADGAGNPDTPRVVSFNHYAFGCVGDYLFRRVAGIRQDQPDAQHFCISPDPDPKLDFVERSYESECGKVSVAFDREHLTVTVPCNATAAITWNGVTKEVGSGTYTQDFMMN